MACLRLFASASRCEGDGNGVLALLAFSSLCEETPAKPPPFA